MNQTIRLVNNIGKLSEQNICFVNVVVQLLHSISEIRNYFLHKEYALSQSNQEKLMYAVKFQKSLIKRVHVPLQLSSGN